MTFNLDLLAAKPTTEAERMLQNGDVFDPEDTSHIEAVQDAIDKLGPQSKFCIEAIFYEGISYSQLGGRLGVSKPHAWRLSKKAMAELERLLINDHSINMRYTMFTTWEEASRAIIDDMDSFIPTKPAILTQIEGMQKRLAQCVRSQIEVPLELIGFVGDMACAQLKHNGIWQADSMHKLLVNKQRDYGHNNINLFGLTGIAIRMCDKIARLLTLIEEGHRPKNEALVDTWQDLVGYSTIAMMVWNETFNLKLSEEK